jgi:hypothetical protein
MCGVNDEDLTADVVAARDNVKANTTHGGAARKATAT